MLYATRRGLKEGLAQVSTGAAAAAAAAEIVALETATKVG